jgi:BlaI family penicillinase repressor
MQCLWKQGKATAREITEELSKSQPIAHSTVQTLLRKLEAKRAVTHELEDRTFIYLPLFKKSEVTASALQDLLTRLFDGSIYGLVSHLIDNERISQDELVRLRELIKEEER